jgi:hypothetical protein
VRLYPLHYLLTRRFAQRLAETLKSLPPAENRARICAEAIQDDAGPDFAQEHFDSYASEYMLSLHFGEWTLFGRDSWLLPHELTEAFLHSNISELRIAQILPEEANCGYIGFEGSSLTLPGVPGPIEGAYWRKVSFAELSIIFVGRTADGSNDMAMRGHEGYRIPFLFTTFNLPADEAIERALQDDVADIESAISTGKFTQPDRLQAANALIARHHAAAPELRKAMALVLNALAFRKAYPDDKRFEWPDGAPPRMVEQAQNPGSANARQRAGSKLWNLGWSPHTVIGPSAARQLGEQMRAFGGRKAHLRDGHWRHQAYGVAFSLRKLIWIWPTVVSASLAKGAFVEGEPSDADSHPDVP